MRNLSLRLFLISGFLLLLHASLFAQPCPDTKPVIIGPDVVRAGQQVTYQTYDITGHTYLWSITGGGTINGSPTSNQVTIDWGSTPGAGTLQITEANPSVAGCISVSLQKTVTIQPLLHAYFYYKFDPTGGCYYNVVNFTADPGVSTHPNDPVVTYTWDFSDGTGSHIGTAAQSYTFPITGAYAPPHTFPVKLTINNSTSQDEIIDYVYVDPDKFKPAADITSITPPPTNCLYNKYTLSGTGSSATPPAHPDPTIKIKYCDWYIYDNGGTLIDTIHSGNGITIPCAMTEQYAFPSPGTYTVSLTITNTINCENTATTTVVVGNTVPSAAYSFTQACVNTTTTFTDLSQANTGTITDWWWSWNDGTGTDHYYLPGNPPPTPLTKVFTDLTPHNVVLKVKNTNLCENTYQTTVQAQPSPNANFAFTPVICDGNPVQFTDMSSPLTGSPIASYLWDFGDPSSPNNTSTDRSPQHLFTAAGSYIVTLTVTNQMGCINTKTLSGNPLVVNPHPDIDFTSALGSTAFEATFTSQVNPAQNVGNNVYWEFGDGLMGAGSPITHAFPGPGNYTVKCKAIDMVTGCTDSVLHNVVLGAPPAACFTANPPNQCQNAVILFQACPPGGLITSETWDFGDGLPPVVYPPPYPISPSHAYAAPGWKHVVRTINAGTATEATWSIDVYIYEAPTANFIWFSDPAHLHQHQACDGQDVYFSDASFANSTPAGTIYKWAWDFGDPASGPSNTSTIANPTHTFTSGIASFNVSLIVWENLQDCPSPATPITVNINTPIPVTFSNNNNVCIDQTVNFTTDPITLPPANYTWLWDFGDGNTSATPGSVSHLYAAVGNYVVTLTLTDLNGCSKSYSKTISIIPKPIANFTFTTPTCFGAAIQFTDLSTVPLPYTDIIQVWDWDFGDGSTHSTAQNPSHIYTVYSTTGWNVVLTVTTNQGCTQSRTINVQQVASPVADFEITGGTFSCVAPQVVHFSDLSQANGGGNLMAWSWNFGDPTSGANNFSTAQNPSHIYNTSGLKRITLIVTNTNYCTDTIYHDTNINALPVPDFLYSTPCLGSNTIFTDNTTPNASGILSWAWDFGDGGTSPLQNPQHLFVTAGAHTVTLVVVNSNGCINTTTKTVTVNPKPVVDFISTSPFCQHAQVTFTSQAYVPAGFGSHFINSWVWRFGDATPTGSGNVVTHTYLDASVSHTVTLITTTNDGCSDSISKVVTGIPAPLADFTYLGLGCLNQPLDFVDNSQTNGGGTITQWAWFFDDPGSGSSNTSTLQNPTHSFTSAAVHHVSLTVTNVNGCITTKTIDVNIAAKPVAAFTSASSCLGNLTVFTDGSSTPTGTLVLWAWDFGDGGTANTQNPTYLFSTPGLHYVTLTVTNSNGCTHSVTNPVEVYPYPVTSFSFSSPTCAGNSVTFTDMSTTGHGYIVRRMWNFGDGNLLNTTSVSATHQYANGGTYNVTLIVKTSDSCTGTKMISVPIQFAPVASFTAINPPCVLTPVQFNDNSQPNGGGAITQWNWNFGDPGSGGNNNSTQQNPVHNFSTSGVFKVRLTIANADGCTGKDSLMVTINANPVANFTATNACQGNATTFTDNSTSTAGAIVSWLWDFGDGGSSAAQSPTYTYVTGGIFNVRLTVTTSNGCVHSVSKPVEVWARPNVQFSYTSPTCAGSSVTFTDISATYHGYVTNRSWDFGDGNTGSSTSPTISHTYTTGGNYQVTLTITTSDNCTGLNTISVPIQYNPISGFQWSNTDCALFPVQFTDISQPNGGGQITQWNWNFSDPGSGGNNTSTQQNPTHSFSAAGQYIVHLKVTNASGCFKDSSAQVTIEANPTANFTATSVCKGSPTVFTDGSTGGSIVQWFWNFGDGGTSTIKNPTYTYANSGTYNVVLTVKTSGGCPGTITKPVTIYGSPVSQFSFSSPTCASDSVQFTDLSVAAHGSITKWEWDFGDGGNVTITFPASPNVKHKYVNGGNFNVKLKITTSDNCTNEIILPVSVEFKPIANFSNASGACALMPNEFTDLSQQNGGTAVVSWLWDFGDPTTGANNTSDQKNPTHAFSAGGPFWVKLQVTNATGCYDTLRKQISVNAAPSPKFTFDTACISSPTQFHDNSTSSTGTINAWLWNFGDPSSGANNTSTLQNPVHTYAAPGNYMVDLKVTNTNTCSRDTIIQIAVSPKPIALFQYNAACAQDTTYFTDLSIAPNSQIVAWNWDFGDGGTATTKNPAHKYATAGTFSVKEIVTNLSGCTDTVTVSVLVHVKPVAAYQFTSKYCPKGQVTFQDMSTATAAVITNRLWIFEQGATSTVANPVYTFPVTDTTYLVTLMVTDTYGCKDTIIDSVHVKPGFRFSFVDSTVCFGNPTIFHPVNYNVGQDSLYSPRWDFGDPNSGPANYSSLYNTTHVFTAPGLYNVKLRVFNSDNCVDSVFRTVQVYALPKPHFSAAIAQCDSVMHFTDTTSNFGTGTIKQWEWIFGDGSPNVIITTPPGDTSHWYVAPGDYQVTLIVTNTKGCVDSITQGVTRLPCIRANYNYPDTNCMNYMVTFTDTSVPTYRIKEWKWTWGDGKDTSYIQYSKFVVHKFTSPGTFQVKLWIKAVVNSKNILDSLTQQVLIHPTPKTLFSNVPVCLKQPAMFRDTSFTNGEPVSAWKWDFGEPSSIPKDTSTLKNPSHIYATRDTFNVKLVVMNRFGCKDSLIKPLRIYGLPLARFNYTAACTGDPTFFRDSSSISDTTIGFWRWKFNPTVLKDTSLLKDPSFKYKTAGDYLVRLVVRDYFGCKDTIDSTITVHVTPVSAFTLINGYDGTPGKVKLNNLSSGASGYSWDFGNGKTSNDTNPVASFTEDGTYTIRLISSNQFGCVDTTYYEYKILFRGLFIPNAFAPSSGNMAVRLFQPVGMNLKTYHIQVFDTWGHQIWESNKLDNNGAPLEGWDGTLNGALMPQGNYFWKVTATFVDDSPWTGSDTGVKGGGGTMGTVILLR